MQGGWNMIYLLVQLGTNQTVDDNLFNVWLEVEEKRSHRVMWFTKMCVCGLLGKSLKDEEDCSVYSSPLTWGGSKWPLNLTQSECSHQMVWIREKEAWVHVLFCHLCCQILGADNCLCICCSLCLYTRSQCCLSHAAENEACLCLAC